MRVDARDGINAKAMPVTSKQPTRSLTAVFTRRLGRTAILFATLALIAFAVVTHRIYRNEARRSLMELGAAFAAALDVGPNGDVSASAAAFQDRYPRVLAVATLDAFGNIESVHPERTAHRQAIQTVLRHRGEGVTLSSPDSGRVLTVAGVVVPIAGGRSAATRQVCILLKYDAFQDRWVSAIAEFALWFLGLSFAGVVLTRRWFDRRVARPLRRAASVARSPLRGEEQRSALGRCDLREVTELTEVLDELMRHTSESEAHARRVERESKHELRQRERGFDQALRRANDLATVDPLTKLRNRAFLEAKLESLYSEQRKASSDFSAVMIDVDNFKNYNDSEGHQAGDALLQFIGALLQGTIRGGDHAVRYGGDEFLLLFPATDAVTAGMIAERLVKLFGQYVNRLGRHHSLSLSAGVASLNADAPVSGHDLLSKADDALYTAKRRGKNAVATCSAA